MREELVMDRFRVLERLGSGGMGTVHRAFDERLQRSVAVKEVAAEPERILREAQAAARLNHPAIVTLYELGERDGRALLVSEFVPGDTLDHLLAQGLLADRDIAELGTDLCEALAHAHARGVVHRDVKPQNVIVRHDTGHGRRAKLMDFGIARIAGSPTLTATGQVVGTLAYMSPEQADGRVAGSESDVYSLALALYECWTGENPVVAPTPAATARRIGMPLPALGDLRPDLPASLTDAIDCCLDPDPELRPSALELRDALNDELAALDAWTPLDPSDAWTPLDPSGVPEAESERRPLARQRVATLAGTAIALALVAGPLGATGLGLVLAVAAIPTLLAGAGLAGGAPLAAPLLGATGLGTAAAALGSFGPRLVPRGLLGAGAWIWLLCGSLGLGVGPDLGIATAAPAGWTSDASLATEAILVPLVQPASLLGMATFALAAMALGWLLNRRHLPLALLGALLWAAGLDAALTIVGDGELGGSPFVAAGAALACVAVEFGLLRSFAEPPGEDADPAPRGGARPAYVANPHPASRI